MEFIKKRDLKLAKNTVKESGPQTFRMSENFKVLVGDDTGLLKNVKMTYKYQVDIVGSYMSKHIDKQNAENDVFDLNDE